MRIRLLNSAVYFIRTPTTMIISIEGNIGSGKSTLLNILKKRYAHKKNIMFIEEPVEEWKTVCHDGKSILALFYENKQKYSLSFQILTYITRLRKLLDALKNHSDKIIICERSIYTDKFVFAQMLKEQRYIDDIQWKTYNYWFDTFIDATKLDHIIYINTTPDVCYNRIKIRSRKGEADIPLEYLQHCDRLHREWLLHSRASDIVTSFNGNEDLSQPQDFIDRLSDTTKRILSTPSSSCTETPL